MLTSPVFRHAKPGIRDFATAVPRVNLPHATQLFTDSIAFTKRNLGTFDVLTQDGRVLNREGRIDGPDYWFDGDTLRVKVPGSYVLREYTADLTPSEAATIQLAKNIVLSDGTLPKTGIPFWPEILTQASAGIARVSIDGRNISFCCPTPGVYAFSYRLRNYYNQVSEPACVQVTVA